MMGRQGKGRGRQVEIPKSGSGGFREFWGNEFGEGFGLNSRGAFRGNSGGRRGREGRNSAERGEGNRHRAGCAGGQMEEEISGHRGGEGLLTSQGGVSAGFRRRGPGEATNSETPTGQWGELPRASGFRERRVGFLRGSGLNSADWRRGAGIRIRGVRTS